MIWDAIIRQGRSAAVSGALVLAVAAPCPVAAQYTSPPPQAVSRDPADALSIYMRTLAVQPRDLAALLGAGDAALALGDANGALGFFARADQVDRRSGRAKAGLGAALVMLERPNDALSLFGQAISLGLSEADVARDRGLAYDLRGDSRRAQRDYALALKRGPDDEVTRRYALSLGNSGDRAQAMALLDPLLRKQDQSAWRARTFVFAMTGDVAAANAIARQVMPASLAQSMTPFLARLASLNAADRAHAVNFGTIPSNGQTYAAVEIGDPFRPIGGGSGRAGDALIPAGDPFGPRPSDVQPERKVEPLSREPRRRPGRGAAVASAAPTVPTPGPEAAPETAPAALPPPPARTSQRVGTRIGTRIAVIDPAKLPPEARGEASQAVRVDRIDLPPPSAAPVASPPPSEPVTASERPAFETTPAPAVSTPAPAPVPATLASVAVPGTRLANILAGIEPEAETAPVALPDAAAQRAAKRAAQRKLADAAALAAAEKAEKAKKAAELEAVRRNPERLWVQVAAGSNKGGLPLTWRRIRDDHPDALKGREAWSAPFKAMTRLLVGPMKSPADARSLVNALAKNGLSAMTFSSEAGQEVARVAAK